MIKSSIRVKIRLDVRTKRAKRVRKIKLERKKEKKKSKKTTATEYFRILQLKNSGIWRPVEKHPIV